MGKVIRWSKEEDSQLIADYTGGKAVIVIANTLGRSVTSVESRLYTLGWTRTGRNGVNSPAAKRKQAAIDREDDQINEIVKDIPLPVKQPWWKRIFS